MTISVDGIYEGDGVLKLEHSVAIKEKTKVHVTIEAQAEPTGSVRDDDPTGWKAARELIGCITEELVAPDVSVHHDHYVYRRDR